MDNLIDKKEIINYVNYIDNLIEKYPKMDEENTKTKIIEPFLKLLNWNVIYDLELEYSVNNTESVDYATINNSKLCIEVKRLDKSISNTDINQLEKYILKGDFTYGLITNGIVYKLYCNRDSKIYSIFEIEKDEFISNIDLIHYLSKSRLNNLDSATIYNEKRAKKIIINNRIELKHKITDLIINETNNSIEDICIEESDLLIERLLYNSRLNHYNKFKNDINNCKRTPYYIFVSNLEKNTDIKIDDNHVDEKSVVFSNKTKSNREHYREFFEYLYCNNYIKQIHIPIKSNGKKLYLLHHKPVNQDGTKMRSYKEINCDNKQKLYLYSHGDKKQFKNRIYKLINKFTLERK